MSDETEEPSSPGTAGVLPDGPGLFSSLESSETPAALAVSVAPYLLGIGSRILAMSERPDDWPMFLSRLLEQLRAVPIAAIYEPL